MTTSRQLRSALNRMQVTRRSSMRRFPGALPAKRRGTTRFDPPSVHYTPAWFGLGALATVLSLMAWRRRRVAIVASGAAGLLSLAYMVCYEPTHPILERVTLRLPSLPAALDGLRIGQISDLHLGLPHTAANTSWAVAQMSHEQPDLLVLTGDFVANHHAIPELPPLLRGLSVPLGVYAVPGNHDYWEGLHDLSGALALAGVSLLINEHQRLHYRGADLWLAGVDDIWDGRPDLQAALDGIPAGAWTLLLCHAPDSAEDAAREGVALQLSGHTHGGHLRLPLLGPFTRPRYGVRYVIGQYRVGTMTLYVSRGIGGAPLRLLCRPEATILTLRRG